MTRYKWLFANWTTSIDAIRSMMLAAQFTEANSEGFILSRANSSRIEGKFIQKNTYTMSQESPLGEIIKSIRVDYVDTTFCLTNGTHTNLELLNPPRTVRPFISRLHEMMGLGMVIKDLSIDPLLWAKEIEKQSKTCWISEIQACGIRISDNSVAKVSASGNSDVRNDFFNFISGRDHSIQQVKLYIVVYDKHEKKCLLELRQNGIVEFHNSVSTTLHSVVRDSLNAEVVRRNNSDV